jgi:hypothetical protein
MDVRNIEITVSPLSSDRVCVRADVVSDDRSIPPENYWIDVPEPYSSYLSTSGDAWLALLLPFAVHLSEPLTISRPVDHELFVNVHELMRVWNCWYPHLSPIRIEADVRDQATQRAFGATAALFSGGVDAWFTFLTNNDPGRADRTPIDDLLCVWGLDIPLSRPDDFSMLSQALASATSGSGTAFVDVATNLHQTPWWARSEWGPVAHGCALAAISHALGNRYSRLLVPSSHRYDDLVPWGSHPLTDPLLSSSLTRIVHDGAAFSRVQKMEEIAKSQEALDSLQVCWASGRYQNCGECPKCLRSMTTLYLLDALDRCPRFASNTIDKGMLAKNTPTDESSRAFLREVRALAMNKGKRDIARAIDRSLRRGRRIEFYIRSVDRLLGRTPGLRKHIKRLGRRALLRE